MEQRMCFLGSPATADLFPSPTWTMRVIVNSGWPPRVVFTRSEGDGPARIAGNVDVSIHGIATTVCAVRDASDQRLAFTNPDGGMMPSLEGARAKVEAAMDRIRALPIPGPEELASLATTAKREEAEATKQAMERVVAIGRNKFGRSH